MGVGCKIENNAVENSKNLDVAMLATPVTLSFQAFVDAVKSKMTGKFSLDATNAVGKGIREVTCKLTGEKGKDGVDNFAANANKKFDTYILPTVAKAWVYSYDMITFPINFLEGKFSSKSPSSTKK